jgi:hypothetical protein
VPYVQLELSAPLRLEQAQILEALLRENGWTDLARAVRRSMEAGMLTDDEYAVVVALLAARAEQDEVPAASAEPSDRVEV